MTTLTEQRRLFLNLPTQLPWYFGTPLWGESLLVFTLIATGVSLAIVLGLASMGLPEAGHLRLFAATAAVTAVAYPAMALDARSPAAMIAALPLSLLIATLAYQGMGGQVLYLGLAFVLHLVMVMTLFWHGARLMPESPMARGTLLAAAGFFLGSLLVLLA